MKSNQPKKQLKPQYAQATIPPVLIRSASYGTPLIHRTQSRHRRKFALSLNNLGAEVLFPAVPVIKPGWRLLSGFLTAALAALILMATVTAEFNVNQMEVKGLQRLTASDLEAALNLTNLKIFVVDPKRMKSDLEDAFPELANVSVKVAMPSKILISVMERQPVLEWRYDDLTVWIDNDGVIFPPRGEASGLLTIYSDSAPPLLFNAPPPPVEEFKRSQLKETSQVEEAKSKKLVDPLLVKTALTLRRQMPSDTPLAYHQHSGLGWSDPQGWNVFIGSDLNNLDQKMVVYQGIAKHLSSQGIHPRMISVEHVHAPFYRLE